MVMLMVACCMGGCVFSGASAPKAAEGAEGAGGADVSHNVGSVKDPAPFRAVTARVHPLTHLDGMAGERGDQCMLLVHYELKDSFGDSVRDIGVLRVELQAAQQPMVGWDIPQTLVPAENVQRFDPSTRTYRVVLSVPRAVCEEAAKKGSVVTVRVVYSMPQTKRTLRDEYELPAAK